MKSSLKVEKLALDGKNSVLILNLPFHDKSHPYPTGHQASPSMRFSRQEYWSGVPLPSPGIFPDPGIEPRSPTL